jgi:hypothetical protein
MLVPCCLLLAGVASVVHGTRFHATTVLEEQEVEITIPSPGPFLPSAPFGQPPPLGEPPPFGEARPFDGSPPFGPSQPFGGQQPFLTKIKEKVLVPMNEPEWKLVREVTIGGVVLLPSGELKRTYSGKAPSLCPT